MELANYEYTVAQESEGKWALYKRLMLSAYALFAALYFLIAYISRFIPIVAILPLFLWILVYFTYKYVKPEYKYEIREAHLTFYKIFGKKEKEIIKIKICDADSIIPLEHAVEEIKAYAPKNTYSAIPSVKSTDLYIILYKNNLNEPSAFMFKATSDALKCLKFYNRKTVITDTEV